MFEGFHLETLKLLYSLLENQIHAHFYIYDDTCFYLGII